jgi:hypothetical protein
MSNKNRELLYQIFGLAILVLSLVLCNLWFDGKLFIVMFLFTWSFFINYRVNHIKENNNIIDYIKKTLQNKGF